MRVSLAVLSLMLLAGCQTAAPDSGAAPSVGLSSANETCRAQTRSSGARTDTPVWDVLCGASERPVGAVHSAIDMRRAEPARAFADSNAYRSLTARANCPAPKHCACPMRATC